MKTLLLSVALFLVVTAFVVFNYFFLNNFIDDIKYSLELMPTTVEELESLDDFEKYEYHLLLDDIREKWEKRETYMCLSLNHNVAREFLSSFIPASSYFDTSEYPDFLANIREAKDTLEHLSFDEGICLGNIL